MKRVFSILVITAVIALGNLTAQANTAPLMTVNTTAIAAAVQEEAEEAVADETESLSFTQELKKAFYRRWSWIYGYRSFMSYFRSCNCN